MFFRFCPTDRKLVLRQSVFCDCLWVIIHILPCKYFRQIWRILLKTEKKKRKGNQQENINIKTNVEVGRQKPLV